MELKVEGEGKENRQTYGHEVLITEIKTIKTIYAKCEYKERSPRRVHLQLSSRSQTRFQHVSERSIGAPFRPALVTFNRVFSANECNERTRNGRLEAKGTHEGKSKSVERERETKTGATMSEKYKGLERKREEDGMKWRAGRV